MSGSGHEPSLPPAVARIAGEADELHRRAYETQVSDAPSGEVPAPAQEQPVQPVEGSEDWKHKYDSLKGRYDTEIPRLREQISGLLGETTAMRGVLAAMETASAQPEPRDPGFTTLPADQRLTADEIASYGEDMVGVIKKAAREIAHEMTADLRTQVSSLQNKLQSVGSTVATSAREKMTAAMESQVPGWHEQNNDAGFNDWLNQRDPYSGYVRREMLTHAWDNNHAERVVAFFKGYRDETAATAPRTERTPAPAQPARVDLNQFVAPGRPTGGAASGATPNTDPIFTKADVSRFYKNVSLGKFNGRETDQQELERAIFKAGQEGRIR